MNMRPKAYRMISRFDLALTPDEAAYVEPIIEMAAHRKKAKRVETLAEWVARWYTFAENMDAYAHHFEEFANEVSVREIRLGVMVVDSLPQSLAVAHAIPARRRRMARTPPRRNRALTQPRGDLRSPRAPGHEGPMRRLLFYAATRLTRRSPKR
ncbi:MAG TPA: hypothetical protein VFX19_03820 [Dehalococcoidia bacterium]|jgi:hypothetical protein|nr:hypothetical protein [Dehalococcoidia bacterium]